MGLRSFAALLLAFNAPGVRWQGSPAGTRWVASISKLLQRSAPAQLNDVLSDMAEDGSLTQDPLKMSFSVGDGSQAASKKDKEGALIKWLGENGVWVRTRPGWGVPAHPLRVESDTMEDFESTGRGLICRQPINQGQAMVRVPEKLLMTKEVAVKQLGPRVISKSLGEYLAVATLLIHERSLGAASFWKPYIDILPYVEEIGQSWTWSDEDLEYLRGSRLVETTRNFRDKIRSDYDLLVAEVIEPNGLDKDVFSWEAFEWAMCMLFSRAVNLRETGELGLVPYADLVNHSPYVQAFFNYESVLLSPEREVILYADRPYAVNDQVLISYGQKANSELLLLYGFVVDRNVFDEVEISIGLSPEDPRYDEKVEFLAEQGKEPAMAFPLLIDRFSNELIQYLRLCCISPRMGPLDEYFYNEQISVENELQAYNVLREGCQSLLDAYDNTENEDFKLIQNTRMFASLPRNARMAIKLRFQEKRILGRTIDVCDTAIAAVKQSVGLPV